MNKNTELVDRIIKENTPPAVPSPYEWQPIETAPKDGHVVDLWVTTFCFGRERETRYADCYWSKSRSKWMKGGYDFETDGMTVTHWIRIGTPTKKEKA